MAMNMSDLAVTTLAKYSDQLYDNVLKSNFLLSRLQKKGKVKLLAGGKGIEESLMYAENETFKWYDGYETLSTASNPVLTSAFFDWKQSNANVVISGREVRESADSETRKHDLLKTRIEVCETTMQNKIAAALFSTRDAVKASGYKMIEGLPIVISKTINDAAELEYGGISPKDQTWWRNKCKKVKTSKWTSSEEGLLQEMRTMFINCTRGTDKPTMIICDGDTFDLYETALVKNKRFVETEKADGSFMTVSFKGVPVFYDENCPKNTMYFINDKYLFFKVHKDANFKMMSEKAPYNQDALVFPMIFMGNLTCSNRSLQGVLFKEDKESSITHGFGTGSSSIGFGTGSSITQGSITQGSMTPVEKVKEKSVPPGLLKSVRPVVLRTARPVSVSSSSMAVTGEEAEDEEKLDKK